MGMKSKVLRCGALIAGAIALTAPTVSASTSTPAAATLQGDAAQISEYMNKFLERFSSISEQRRGKAGQRAMIPLLRHTKSNYARTPAQKAEGAVDMDPTLAIIAKLWMHGPKSWDIKDITIQGNEAYALVDFQSIKAGRPEPIPFGFRFAKVRKEWKINGFVDLRETDDAGNVQNLIVQRTVSSPEAVFTKYMGKIEEYYSPQNAKKSIQLAPQIKQELAPWWLPKDDAEQSMSVSLMTFSQLQPRNWQFVSSDFVEENAELVIKASAGNPVMRRNLGMATMMGSGLKFTLERMEDEWLLKEYGRDRKSK